MGGYRPNPQVLEKLKTVHFVGVIGPTGAGKSTLIHAACQQDPSLHMVRNNTSRAPRPEEVGGTEYQFRSREEMLARIEKGEFVQVAPLTLTDLYATAPEDYNPDGISLLPIMADAVPTFRALPFASFNLVYVLPPDFETWLARVNTRHFSPEKLATRLQEAVHSLEFAISHPEISFVINSDKTKATAQFVALVLGRPQSKTDDDAARQLAGSLVRQVHQQKDVSL